MINKNDLIEFVLNDKLIKTDLKPTTLVLDFVREHEKLTGTKSACREGDCGSCMILLGKPDSQNHQLINYKAVCSCLLPLGDIHKCHIVTIEGINDKELNPIQGAFVDFGASQCGYCTPGFIISLTAYFLSAEDFNNEKAITSIEGNICRCTGHASIIRAAKSLNKKFAGKLISSNNRLSELVNFKIVPGYFLEIPEMIHKIDERIIKPVKSKKILAGGTDLYVQKEEQMLEENYELIFNKKLYGGIYEDKNYVYLGAGATTEEIKNSEIFNNIVKTTSHFFRLISSLPIRDRATVGGNIINASPIADLTIFLLALDAILIIERGKNTYELRLNELYLDYKKLKISTGDTIKQIKISKKFREYKFNFEKVSKREYLDIASVNTAISILYKRGKIKDILISAGGVAPIPKYLINTSKFLINKSVEKKNILEASEIMLNEISPISDIRGSAKYKSMLLKRLFFTHFITLFPELDLQEVLS